MDRGNALHQTMADICPNKCPKSRYLAVLELFLKNENPLLERVLGDGAKRIRTADPLHAMQVLYQLSYGPITTTLHLRLAATPQLVGLALLPDLQAG